MYLVLIPFGVVASVERFDSVEDAKQWIQQMDYSDQDLEKVRLFHIIEEINVKK